MALKDTVAIHSNSYFHTHAGRTAGRVARAIPREGKGVLGRADPVVFFSFKIWPGVSAAVSSSKRCAVESSFVIRWVHRIFERAPEERG